MSTLAIKPDPAVLPMQFREAPIGAVDVKTRTVTVVFTTGAAVRRMRYDGWDGVPFDEILVVTREAVDLSRLNAGAPALDSHSRWSTSSQVGVTENARIVGNEGLADIRFPTAGTDEACDRMFSMVDQKIIRNVSGGYFINQVRVVPPAKQDEVEKRYVERWQPFEISFVPVGADAGAQTRASDPMHPLTIVRAPGLHVPAARMRMRAAQLQLRGR